MGSSRIQAVVWDVDDTLFDYGSADLAGMRAHLAVEGLLEEHGGEQAALARWKSVSVTHWRRFVSGETDFEGHRRDRVREFLGTTTLTETQATAWWERYVAHYESAWSLFPDAAAALTAVAGVCRQAVLSNASLLVQERKLSTLGVRDHFESVVCAVELGIAKPEAGAFLHVCEALGLAPAQVAYVGDDREVDGVGARDAGLRSIWVDRDGTRGRAPEGVERITGLAELPVLLTGQTRFGARSTFG
ncbi:HAD family hydrolase [Streptomyces sp. NPDC058374]|uniref:HAD family hydrolase n=1 Tax=unclassified Streptomyces TaxID=2593676 RepID=UPI0036514A5A